MNLLIRYTVKTEKARSDRKFRRGNSWLMPQTSKINSFGFTHRKTVYISCKIGHINLISLNCNFGQYRRA